MPCAATPETADDIQIDEVALTAAVPVPPSAAPQPELLPDTPVTLAALEDQPITELPIEEPAPSFTCEIAMTAQPVAAAMVKLDAGQRALHGQRKVYRAPQRHDVQHGPLAKTARPRCLCPRWRSAAVFIASFASGDSAVATQR